MPPLKVSWYIYGTPCIGIRKKFKHGKSATELEDLFFKYIYYVRSKHVNFQITHNDLCYIFEIYNHYLKANLAKKNGEIEISKIHNLNFDIIFYAHIIN